MRLLILGGTRFLGRHIAAAAIERGHEVTLFHRGETLNPFGNLCTVIRGHRDGVSGAGLSGLEEGTWDVVIDTSGYLPRQVHQSAAMLKDRCDRYVFISSASVYADLSRPALDENSPLAPLPAEASPTLERDYGALKAACEVVVSDLYGSRALILRPGLIIGPHDPTDRFPYWAVRFGAPTLLGRGSQSVAMPQPTSRPIQCIDARDIASWLFLLLQGTTGGVFNVVSDAGAINMGTLAEAGHRLSVTRGFHLSVRWIDESELIACNVAPWTGLPLWIPMSDPAMAGLLQIDGRRARDAGLTTRPLLQSLEDTLEWLVTEPGALDGRFTKTLDTQTEAGLLGVAVP